MKRGEIYFILNPQPRQDGAKLPERPALIVSGDHMNGNCDTVQICYLSEKPWRDLPTHVQVRPSGLAPSFVLCEQVYTINTRRLGNCAGMLTPSELAAVNAALAISLDLDFGQAAGQQEAAPKVDCQRCIVLAMAEKERDVYRDMYCRLLEQYSALAQFKGVEVE